jgi:hypothetical protein
MKLLITFVLGALTGACLLWFGFSKTVIPLSGNLVMVDRFTGKASRVFVSIAESEEATAKEFARMEELQKNPPSETKAEAAPAVEQPQWRLLNEPEIKRLEFEWRIDMNVNRGAVFIKYHNPFDKNVKFEKVRIQIPAKNGRAAIDREYETNKDFCPPQADSETMLYSLKMPMDEFYELVDEAAPKASDSDPFGSADAPAQKKGRRLVGTVTPARVLIQQ